MRPASIPVTSPCAISIPYFIPASFPPVVCRHGMVGASRARNAPNRPNRNGPRPCPNLAVAAVTCSGLFSGAVLYGVTKLRPSLYGVQKLPAAPLSPRLFNGPPYRLLAFYGVRKLRQPCPNLAVVAAAPSRQRCPFTCRLPLARLVDSYRCPMVGAGNGRFLGLWPRWSGQRGYFFTSTAPMVGAGSPQWSGWRFVFQSRGQRWRWLFPLARRYARRRHVQPCLALVNRQPGKRIQAGAMQSALPGLLDHP